MVANEEEFDGDEDDFGDFEENSELKCENEAPLLRKVERHNQQDESMPHELSAKPEGDRLNVNLLV